MVSVNPVSKHFPQ